MTKTFSQGFASGLPGMANWAQLPPLSSYNPAQPAVPAPTPTQPSQGFPTPVGAPYPNYQPNYGPVSGTPVSTHDGIINAIGRLFGGARIKIR